MSNVGLDEPRRSGEKDEREEEVEISTRLSPLTRRSHSPMTREGDSSLLEEQDGISNTFLMLRAWPVKTFAPWVGGTFLGRCDRFGAP